jgi:serine/threonine-protein kinase/endoribonuclease IRE1
LKGYGSHGTIVLKGSFQGRTVAVKRLLRSFVTIASHEVKLLQESDDHPNVIRYFCKEQREEFLYIALEFCPATLADLIEKPMNHPELTKQFDAKKGLRQITLGLRHLHKMKIIHRDIKPQNILVAWMNKKNISGGLRMLISDFGLCKKLEIDESSFLQTVNHAAGSFGYRAPEVLKGEVVMPNNPEDPGILNNSSNNSTDGTATNGSSNNGSVGTGEGFRRLTRSIDIFSLGCVFYYVLTYGEHPFGQKYEREVNIFNGKSSLNKLLEGEDGEESKHLILQMIKAEPKER